MLRQGLYGRGTGGPRLVGTTSEGGGSHHNSSVNLWTVPLPTTYRNNWVAPLRRLSLPEGTVSFVRNGRPGEWSNGLSDSGTVYPSRMLLPSRHTPTLSSGGLRYGGRSGMGYSD